MKITFFSSFRSRKKRCCAIADIQTVRQTRRVAHVNGNRSTRGCWLFERRRPHDTLKIKMNLFLSEVYNCLEQLSKDTFQSF